MRATVSVPDATFEAAERAARRLRMSRSQLYAAAVRQFVALLNADEITATLDAVYAASTSSLDPGLAVLQTASLPAADW